jgi:branched-chain amino acid transport system permease protein
MTTEALSPPVQSTIRRPGIGLGWSAGLATAVLGAIAPVLLTGQPFLITLAAQANIAAIVALSLDLLIGNTGLLSFGHAAWFGIGGYAAGLLAKLLSPELLILLPLTMFIAAAISALTGAILVRQIGKTFAILTLALSQVFYSLVFVTARWTGGEDGLQGIPIPTLAGFQIISPAAWYWVVYAVLLLALAFALYLRRTPLGKAWLALKSNTDRARFIGIPVLGLKISAYVLAAAFAALAGALLALLNGATSPDTMDWVQSGNILMYVVLGGVGTIVGPVLGAIAFTFAQNYVSGLTDAWLIYFGGLFVIVVIVVPGGLFGLPGMLRANWLAWRRRMAP